MSSTLTFDGSSAAYTPPSGVLLFSSLLLLTFLPGTAPPADDVVLTFGSDHVMVFRGSSGVYYAPEDKIDFGRDSSFPDIPQPQPMPGVVSGFRMDWGDSAGMFFGLQLPSPAPRLLDTQDRLAVAAPQARYEPVTLSVAALRHTDTQDRLQAETGLPRAQGAALADTVAVPKDSAARTPWHDAPYQLDAGDAIAWRAPPPKDQGVRLPFESTVPARFSGEWFVEPYTPRPADQVLLDFGVGELHLDGSSVPYTPPSAVLAFNTSTAPSDSALHVELLWAPLRDPSEMPEPADHELRLVSALPTAIKKEVRLVAGQGKPRIVPIGTPWQSDPNPPDNWPPVLQPAEVYFVSNNFQVLRMPDETDITSAVLGGNVSIDRGSWSWTGQLAIGTQAAMNLIKPVGGPKTIQVTVNGFTLVLAVTQYSRGVAFGKRTWIVKVQSTSAFLGAPYAPPSSLVSTELKSASQLALDQLSGSGWTLDWQVPDWNVDVGQWSYQSLTPIDAICTLARAVGAIVQTDPAEQTLHVVSKYPHRPMDWATATPDVLLPASILTRVAGQWAPSIPYNAVLLTGGNQGININCIRQGTAGDNPMQPITDALILDPVMGQERGRVELDGCGDAELVDFDLPIIDPIGVQLPGALALVTEDTTWPGQVWQTTLNLGQGKGGVGVSQTLKIEGRPS